MLWWVLVVCWYAKPFRRILGLPNPGSTQTRPDLWSACLCSLDLRLQRWEPVPLSVTEFLLESTCCWHLYTVAESSSSLFHLWWNINMWLLWVWFLLQTYVCWVLSATWFLLNNRCMMTAIADCCDMPHMTPRSLHLQANRLTPSLPFAMDHMLMMLFSLCLSTLKRSSTTAAVVPSDLLSLVANFSLSKVNQSWSMMTHLGNFWMLLAPTSSFWTILWRSGPGCSSSAGWYGSAHNHMEVRIIVLLK